MPYVTSVERIGVKKGIEQGIQQGIQFVRLMIWIVWKWSKNLSR